MSQHDCPTPTPEDLPTSSPADRQVVDGVSLIGLTASLATGESGTILQQLAGGQVLLVLQPDHRLVCQPLTALTLITPPHLPEGPNLLTLDEAAKVLSISSRTLRRRLADAPPNLDGAPINIGSSDKRRRLRWVSGDIVRWAKAYERWRRSGRKASKHRPRRRTRAQSSARGGSLYAQAFSSET